MSESVTGILHEQTHGILRFIKHKELLTDGKKFHFEQFISYAEKRNEELAEEHFNKFAKRLNLSLVAYQRVHDDVRQTLYFLNHVALLKRDIGRDSLFSAEAKKYAEELHEFSETTIDFAKDVKDLCRYLLGTELREQVLDDLVEFSRKEHQIFKEMTGNIDPVHVVTSIYTIRELLESEEILARRVSRQISRLYTSSERFSKYVHKHVRVVRELFTDVAKQYRARQGVSDKLLFTSELAVKEAGAFAAVIIAISISMILGAYLGAPDRTMRAVQGVFQMVATGGELAQSGEVVPGLKLWIEDHLMHLPELSSQELEHAYHMLR
ncbi:hypothetical protein H6504_00355 [Candidatus Woesearchaeota archaeon]|nr:hypothetical protein [Candidatus Woesearchaeota archaeon]